MKTHGLSYTVEYRIWNAIRNRCRNQNNQNYNQYGGRGIDICDEWYDDFLAFYNHVGERPDPGMNLDRIDNERGYEPENVRWVTAAENNRNKRSNRRVTWNGVEYVFADLAKEVGISVPTLKARIDNLGWSLEKAVKTPVRKAENNICAKGHPYVEGSYYIWSNGKRRCKECQKEYDAQRR